MPSQNAAVMAMVFFQFFFIYMQIVIHKKYNHLRDFFSYQPKFQKSPLFNIAGADCLFRFHMFILSFSFAETAFNIQGSIKTGGEIGVYFSSGNPFFFNVNSRHFEGDAIYPPFVKCSMPLTGGDLELWPPPLGPALPISSICIRLLHIVMAPWPSGSERRFCDGHDRKVDDSTTTQASLLRPWVRFFTTIISGRWNLTSSKLKKLEAKLKRKTLKHSQLLNESGFVLGIAPRSLIRDRRIKMKIKEKKKIT